MMPHSNRITAGVASPKRHAVAVNGGHRRTSSNASPQAPDPARHDGAAVGPRAISS
jgi:hypothetical protein